MNKRQKKLARKKQFLKTLTNAGIAYHYEKKCKWHYYIDVPVFQGIHFWPTGIGRWYNTTTGDKGIGVATLLTEVKYAKEKEVIQKPSFAKPSFRPTTEAQHRQREIMKFYGMEF